MIKTFSEYRLRREDAGSIGPGLGDVNGMAGPVGRDDASNPGDAAKAFQDLSVVFEKATSGQNGKSVLQGMVNSILNNREVPDEIKREIRSKVQERWSNVVSLDSEQSGSTNHQIKNNDPIVMPIGDNGS